ncbi:MAG: NUDIX hydrolase [Bradymonadales bacterium]|jgi:8-oxo-dGTP diphosphatase
MYKNPTPTVDIIIIRGNEIVLIERQNAPHGWALPGGFVDEGESVENAAIRESKEECSLNISLHEMFYVYSEPSRDPRQHTMSTVFIATAPGEPQGGDDAKCARYFPLDALPAPLCFDHAQIIADFLHYQKTGKRRQLDNYYEKLAKASK